MSEVKVFAWETGNPRGGIRDFIGDYGSIDDAKSHLRNEYSYGYRYQIVDAYNLEILDSGNIDDL